MIEVNRRQALRTGVSAGIACLSTAAFPLKAEAQAALWPMMMSSKEQREKHANSITEAFEGLVSTFKEIRSKTHKEELLKEIEQQIEIYQLKVDEYCNEKLSSREELDLFWGMNDYLGMLKNFRDYETYDELFAHRVERECDRHLGFSDKDVALLNTKWNHVTTAYEDGNLQRYNATLVEAVETCQKRSMATAIKQCAVYAGIPFSFLWTATTIVLGLKNTKQSTKE